MGYFLQKLAEEAEKATEGGTSGLAKSVASGAGIGLGVGTAGAGLAVGGTQAHRKYKKHQELDARATRKENYNNPYKDRKADFKAMRSASKDAAKSGARAQRVLRAVKKNAKWALPALALGGAAAGAAKEYAGRNDED